MKIKIENIETPWYSPREEFNPEFISELGKSLETTGQLDDILLRMNDNGNYELISGSQRLTAAKNLGWNEIDAKIIDVTEEEAAILALESNLIRRSLKEIEEGKAIKQMMERFGLNQKQIAERLQKSDSWVHSRLSVALDITKEVQNAIFDNRISVSQAVIISRLHKSKQSRFLDIIIQKQIEQKRKLSPEETRKEIKRFRNDRIFTIGFSGWKLEDFIKVLKKKNVKVLVDIRDSGKSIHKPEFSRPFLKERVEEAGLKFLDRSELGVPFEIRNAWMEGGLSWECFVEWYSYHATRREGTNRAAILAEELKDLGRPIIMCSERYPTAKGDQKHGCHRDLLAKFMLETDLFSARTDL